MPVLGYQPWMGIFGTTPEAERFGRRYLLCWFGAWLTAAGAELLASGDWPGVFFLAPGVILTVLLARWLHVDAQRRPMLGWARDDTMITVSVLLGSLVVLSRAVISADSAAERAVDLLISPLWVLLAAYYAWARRRALRTAPPATETAALARERQGGGSVEPER